MLWLKNKVEALCGRPSFSADKGEVGEGEAFRDGKVALGSYFRGVLLRALKRC